MVELPIYETICPVVLIITHSRQQPVDREVRGGGSAGVLLFLARAAELRGVDWVLLKTPRTCEALSDGQI